MSPPATRPLPFASPSFLCARDVNHDHTLSPPEAAAAVTIALARAGFNVEAGDFNSDDEAGALLLQGVPLDLADEIVGAAATAGLAPAVQIRLPLACAANPQDSAATPGLKGKLHLPAPIDADAPWLASTRDAVVLSDANGNVIKIDFDAAETPVRLWCRRESDDDETLKPEDLARFSRFLAKVLERKISEVDADERPAFAARIAALKGLKSMIRSPQNSDARAPTPPAPPPR